MNLTPLHSPFPSTLFDQLQRLHFCSCYPSTHAAISRLRFFALTLVRRHLTAPQQVRFLPRRRLDRVGRADAALSLCHSESVLFLLTKVGMNQNDAEAFLQRYPEIESAAAASLGSLRLRIGTLQSIGLTNFFLQRAITKRPDILLSPETGSFLNFIQEEELELLPAKLERLLVSTHPAFFLGLVTKIRLLLTYGFPREKLGHLLNAVDISKVFFKRTVDEIEETILVLQRYGWPDTIVRRPKLLNLDLHSQLIPRTQFFVHLAGGEEPSAAILIRKLPAILSYSVDHLQSHMEFWRSVGLTDEQVFKIALVYPNIFSVGRETKLSSRIEFLVQCGLDAEDIFRFLIKAPLFLSLSFEDNLAKKLAFLVKLGYRYRTKGMALSIGAATRTSTTNMQKVLGLFFSYGFSIEDVQAMSRKHPQVLQYNWESLEKKMEFLIHGMDREVGELLHFPAFLGYKLDDRIKHRYEIKIANRGKGLSINKLLSISDEVFCLKSSKWIETEKDCNADQVIV